MDDETRCALTYNLSNQYFLHEAKTRWLRPSEICEILYNYHRFNLTPDPPNKPPSGSLFLFDRKVLRYFRKDGHCWRKKKDGRTVREAHEKLKSGSIDALHCYYAHGEDNGNFQRRIYWLLDEQLEHIVLVHYRDLSEGSKILLNTDLSTHMQGAQTSSAVCSMHLSSSTFVTQASYPSSPSTADWHGQIPSEFEDADSRHDVGGASLADSLSFASFCGNDKAENNVAGCSGSISDPYSSGLIDTASLCRSFNPFSPNQVGSQNHIPNEGHQNICGASQRAGPFGGAHFSHNTASSTWLETLSLNQKIDVMHERKVSFEQPNCPDSLTRTIKDSLSDGCVGVRFVVHGEYDVLPDAHPQSFMGEGKTKVQVKVENAVNLNSPPAGEHTMDGSTRTYQVPHNHHFYVEPQFKNNSGPQVKIAATGQPREYTSEVSYAPNNSQESDTDPHEHGELNKLDSFGRWMNKEIGKDCDNSLMASVSGNYWNALHTQSGDKEVSSLSRHMQLDIDSLGPSLSQEQLFSILDFSPDWAYSGVETKVLISGAFLGGIEPTSGKWCCMFGEYEVSAEVLTANVICCQAPAHAPGRVPFYITCSNRLACSEVREFEYRENLPGGTFSSALKSVPEDEICFQVRFAKMISVGVHRKRLSCSVKNCHKCILKKNLFSMLSDDVTGWDKIEKGSKALLGYNRNLKDDMIQNLLKDKLHEWLVCKVHEEGKGPNVLDEEGQGVIHLAAALGYQWAMRPIVAAGVSPSFRDARGRTGLHWAAYYGREEAVIALVRLGAAPGAVEDPTSKFPEGQTAADLASIRGHKGIAGYLAESDLTSHLSKLALKETVMETVSSNLVAEEAIETVQGQTIVPFDGDKGVQLSLRKSLAAVKNSALAAARIQGALSFPSICQRQLTKSNDVNSEIPDEVLVLSSLNNKDHRLSHFNDYLHTAAVKIQPKYHGYRGHKDFLKIRNQIVKIQAHVRGHQVCKQYKKIVWSVSIVEKAILRWRRKGSGLRGFQAEKATAAVGQEVGKTDEYEFLHLGRQQKVAGIEKALAKVQSMARHPEAREQYMRLAASSHKSKWGDEGSSSGSSS